MNNRMYYQFWKTDRNYFRNVTGTALHAIVFFHRSFALDPYISTIFDISELWFVSISISLFENYFLKVLRLFSDKGPIFLLRGQNSFNCPEPFVDLWNFMKLLQDIWNVGNKVYGENETKMMKNERKTNGPKKGPNMNPVQKVVWYMFSTPNDLRILNLKFVFRNSDAFQKWFLGVILRSLALNISKRVRDREKRRPLYRIGIRWTT